VNAFLVHLLRPSLLLARPSSIQPAVLPPSSKMTTQSALAANQLAAEKLAPPTAHTDLNHDEKRGFNSAPSYDDNHLEKLDSPSSTDPEDAYHWFTPEQGRKIKHRIDRRLVLMLGAMYCVSLMDRTNLSNAAIAGMRDELAMVGNNRYVRRQKHCYRHIRKKTDQQNSRLSLWSSSLHTRYSNLLPHHLPARSGQRSSSLVSVLLGVLYVVYPSPV
jgi:hypothetical protein